MRLLGGSPQGRGIDMEVVETKEGPDGRVRREAGSLRRWCRGDKSMGDLTRQRRTAAPTCGRMVSIRMARMVMGLTLLLCLLPARSLAGEERWDDEYSDDAYYGGEGGGGEKGDRYTEDAMAHEQYSERLQQQLESLRKEHDVSSAIPLPIPRDVIAKFSVLSIFPLIGPAAGSRRLTHAHARM